MNAYIAQVTMSELGLFFTAIFAAFGTILVGFYKYAQSRENEFEKSRQAMTDAFDASVKSLNKSLDRVAKASERSADEAKARNGHLAELQLKSQELFTNLADRNLKAYQEVQHQSVIQQTVEHSSVRDERVEHKE